MRRDWVESGFSRVRTIKLTSAMHKIVVEHMSLQPLFSCFSYDIYPRLRDGFSFIRFLFSFDVFSSIGFRVFVTFV